MLLDLDLTIEVKVKMANPSLDWNNIQTNVISKFLKDFFSRKYLFYNLYVASHPPIDTFR